MPIDKLTPRQLDADSDSKLVKKTAMLDALNLYSGDTGGSGGDGDMGVLKNIKGNRKVTEAEALPNDARVIGKVEDKKTSLVYLFVYSETAAEQGVWAYDPLGRLPNSETNSLRLIYKSAQFNFPQDGFVKGDIVYSNARTEGVAAAFGELGVDFDKDTLIYFTDNTNEPRKINAYRALLANGSAIHGEEDIYAEADFITACPKTPIKPISFFFRADTSKPTNNFLGVPGFQFAYQNIYKDGIESAISCYSDIAFPPSVINQGASPNPNHEAVNECVLTIPSQGPEIESVRIVARQGNTGSFLVVDEIDNTPGDLEYSFYNDRIVTGVSTDEVNKQFDSVPRKAQGQTTSSNRMMYGNYLDGFDNVQTSCTATLTYSERPQDFVDFNIKVRPSIGVHQDQVQSTATTRKSAGFFLDCRHLPSSISAGGNFEVKLSFSPDRNWHLYNCDGSYHQSHQVGFLKQVNPNVLFDSVNEEDLYRITSPEEAGSVHLIDNDFSCWGAVLVNEDSSGVDSASNMWAPQFTPALNSQNFSSVQSDPFAVKIGSSAGSPLILAGGAITFSVKFTVNQDIDDNFPIAVGSFLESAFSGGDGGNAAFSITESKLESSYDINLGLGDGDKIKQDYVGKSNSDSKSRLIMPVGGKSQLSGAPHGHVIINKATPVFGLEVAKNEQIGPGDEFNSRPFGTASFVFKLKSIGDDPEVHTCLRSAFNFVPDGESPLPSYIGGPSQSSLEGYPLDWLVITKATLSDPDFDDISSFFADNGYPAVVNPDNNEIAYSPEEVFGVWAFSPQVDVTTVGGTVLDPIVTIEPSEYNIPVFQQYWVNQIGYIADPNSIFDPEVPGICLMDGEGGPGGGVSRGGGGNPYDDIKLFDQGSVLCTPLLVPDNEGEGDGLPNVAYGTQDQTTFFRGRIDFKTTMLSNGVDNQTALPLIVKEINENEGYDSTMPYPVPFKEDDGDALDASSVNFKPLQSFVEVLSSAFNFDIETDFSRTFKSNANHDFGVVYYDERGRHGFVNHLKTVFVPDYSSQGRAEHTDEDVLEGGRVSVKLRLDHAPPEWAHYYKIVYAKNTSVKDFVQYTSGGAFASEIQQEVVPEHGNIYVSLNYLQGHSLSYVSSFGARTPEGGLNFYKFEEGDKLIVISAFNGEEREFYNKYELEVVGQVKLGEDDNPLSNDPEENQMGDFVIVRNNPDAVGFTYTEVLSGSDRWGDNCIIELRSPFKEIDLDKRLYYEIGDTYDVVIGNESSDFPGQRLHGSNPITLNKGDVWFRRIPLNVRDQPNFNDLITQNDGEDTDPTPNFKSYYLESNTATDLFRADSSLIGRPNAILEDALETIREATITYSDPSNPESKKVNYSSFNNSLANFKDLSEKHGSINYISDQSDSILAIQENKVSRIPVNRSLLADVKGSSSIIASRNILGEVIHYPGESGCDNDPSSVADIEDAVFFANKSLGKIYRFDINGGVKAVSDLQVASLFRNMFKDALADVPDNQHVRVIGGYDPVKEEYLITVVSLEDKTTTGVEVTEQPSGTVAPTGTEDTDEGGGGGPAPDEEDGDGGGGEDDDGDAVALNGISILDLVQEFLARPDNTKFAALAEQMTLAQFNELRSQASNSVVLADVNSDGAVAVTDLLDLLAAYELDYDEGDKLKDPAAGTLQSVYCEGTSQWGVYADGSGGTYNQIIEENSLQCGYTPPQSFE